MSSGSRRRRRSGSRDSNKGSDVVGSDSVVSPRPAPSPGQKETEILATRTAIVREIVDTERSYVASLSTLIDVFLRPLQSPKKPIIPQDMVQDIFGSISVILGYNQQLLSDLEARVKTWEPPKSCLGDIFLNLVEWLKIYTSYVNRYHYSIVALQDARRSGKFRAFLKDAESDSRTKGLAIEDFLIMPIQRIPRYKMLLEDLGKYTPVGHPDRELLADATEKVRLIATHVNQRKHDAEAMAKVAKIEGMLVELPPSVELTQPHRRFVREGGMFEIEAGKSSKKYRRMLFLFNDAVMVTEPSGASLLRRRSGLLTYIDMHSLGVATFRKLPDEGKMDALFEISLPGNRRYVLLCKSREDRQIWVEELVRCKKEMMDRESYRKVEATKSRAAVTKDLLAGLYGDMDGSGAPYNPLERMRGKIRQDRAARSSVSDRGDRGHSRNSTNDSAGDSMVAAAMAGAAGSAPDAASSPLGSSILQNKLQSRLSMKLGDDDNDDDASLVSAGSGSAGPAGGKGVGTASMDSTNAGSAGSGGGPGDSGAAGSIGAGSHSRRRLFKRWSFSSNESVLSTASLDSTSREMLDSFPELRFGTDGPSSSGNSRSRGSSTTSSGVTRSHHFKTPSTSRPPSGSTSSGGSHGHDSKPPNRA